MAKTHSIEDHLALIETAIAALEAGDLPLEESLTRYEAGLKSVRLARSLLDRYSARLDELRGDVVPPAPA
jgi:exodeoxyribonuclease VII small subunit